MLIKCKTAQYPRNRWCICRRWGALNATSALRVSPLLSTCPPPTRAAAGPAPIYCSPPFTSFSKTRKNNLLPAAAMQTLLLQVRKPLPPQSALQGFAACRAGTACTGPVPVPRCPAALHCCLCLAWPGWPVQGLRWGTAGCSCGVPTLLLGSSPTGDAGGAETRCPSLVAEERQWVLLPRDEARREGCQEDWGERPGASQLKTLSLL